MCEPPARGLGARWPTDFCRVFRYRKNGLYSHCRRFHHRHTLIVANLGVPERGTKADGPWRRAMGTGWVRETLDHDYADAQRRGHPVTLLVTETTGALSPTFDRALRALGKHARAPTTHDSTRYGLSRSSPRTFLAHHRAAISAAVVLADATTISLAAPAMSFKLTMGMSPF